MISEVVMPQMGADMTEGTIVRWLKEEGDSVARGEIIAEIETDKANVEIEAFESGIFRKALKAEGDVVEVGGVIAIIAGADDDISQYVNGTAVGSQTPRQGAAVASGPDAAAPPAAGVRERSTEPPGRGEREPQQATAQAPANGRIRISPVARRLADDLGVDVRTLRGSGPDGRIVKRDVEQAAARKKAEPAPAAAVAPEGRPTHGVAAAPVSAATTSFEQMSKMRQTIARRMAQSKREAPHYYLLVDIDMTEAMTFRRTANETLPEDRRISINDIIVKACAVALQRHPKFNVTLSGDEVRQHDAQHVCIAVALEDGLIAPALLDVGRKPLSQIAVESKDLASRARGGSLRADEMTQGTFTVTNLGAYGVETLVGIIQPPQTAILGVGTVAPQAVVRDGAVVVGQMMKVALSADHRITDGAEGARFLADIKRLLETPALMVV